MASAEVTASRSATTVTTGPGLQRASPARRRASRAPPGRARRCSSITEVTPSRCTRASEERADRCVRHVRGRRCPCARREVCPAGTGNPCCIRSVRVPRMDQRLLDDLLDWLRIPSISTGGGEPADLERAAAWVARARRRRRRRGGACVATERQPAGRRRAARRARGRADRAHLRPLRRAVRRRPGGVDDARRSSPTCATGASTRAARPTTRATSCRCCTSPASRPRPATLPVNVRVLVEGEEETGGEAVAHWVRADERGADCAIVFDSGMVDEHTPAITIGLRGHGHAAPAGAHRRARPALGRLRRQRAQRPARAAHDARRACVPGADGRLREELLRRRRRRPRRPSATPGRGCRPATRCCAAVGARPAYPGAGAEYYERNGAAAVARDQRHPRRRAPHGRARRGPRERLAAPGAGAERAGRAARRSSASCARRCRPAPSWSSSAELAEPSLFPPDNPAVRAVGAGARAGGRRADRVRAHRRLDPGRRRVRRARHPDRGQRLRPGGRRLPRARRVVPAPRPGPGRRRRATSSTRRSPRSERGLRERCAARRGAYCRIEGRE